MADIDKLKAELKGLKKEHKERFDVAKEESKVKKIKREIFKIKHRKSLAIGKALGKVGLGVIKWGTKPLPKKALKSYSTDRDVLKRINEITNRDYIGEESRILKKIKVKKVLKKRRKRKRK